jgi:phenylalanyl-tRNA synthetase beta chain
MKLSLNWIKDYVEIPKDMRLSQLAYDLTMSTVEVEGMVEMGQSFDNMVVGVVDKILPHPNADKLVICKTDVGGGDIREIVCGGCNLSEGMKVAVAHPGAKLRWHGEGELIELKKVKVRGVESAGMICASSEIGLFDLFPFEDEATIIDLSEFEATTGTALAEALGLDDVILEIDNKSLTNRPDLWGHYGIAREIATIYDLPLKEFSAFTPPQAEGFEIIIDDSQRCPRYIGVRIEGVSIKPAPFEIQSRIWRVGMRPINAIVDITNYVMLATGQPTHAFDSDVIKGSIRIRRAFEKEKLLLLNGMDISLTTEDLVIADEVEAVALAGVMGGEKDSILPGTDKMILEIANFDALSVRRTSMRHEIRTEAATRFEKSIDPERGDLALSLAMQMFTDLFPSLNVTGFHDNYPNQLKRKEVDVSVDWLEKRLGKKIPDDELTSKLTRMGFDVIFDKDAKKMNVIAPTWRSTGDISIPDDIVEEIARIHGLENFEPMPIATAFDGTINQVNIDIDRKIREYLAIRCGMQEVYTYPWVSEEYIDAVLLKNDDMLELSAPPSPNERFLRNSLLPNLCEAAHDNLRYFDEFKIFESAQVFYDRDYSSLYDRREKLPEQRKNVAGACVGKSDDVTTLYRKAKGIIEALPRLTHFEPFTYEQKRKPVWADDVIWLNICVSGENVGNLALLSKKATLDCGIKNAAVMLFELDIDSLKPYASRTNEFSRLPAYPFTNYDVSLLFDLSVKWDEIQKTAFGKKSPDNLLRDVSFVEEYRGRQIPEGKKSITLRLLIGSLSKTLTSEEIESCANAVVKRLGKVLGAEPR